MEAAWDPRGKGAPVSTVASAELTPEQGVSQAPLRVGSCPCLSLPRPLFQHSSPLL